ncbi:hypothetical protein N9242_06495 [Vicingaceae bacterium]|nr:hypothetical protein [Vicingaceae bacterium]
MSGVILATALGAFGTTAAATVGTGAIVSAGIGAGTTLYGGAKSFSNANKARKRGQAAEEAARKSVDEARKKIDINRMEQLSISKEPYELMRDALLTQGATGLQAGVEGETRGAAATAGRLQMAQNLQQGQVRGEMGQRMDEINKLVAQEDARIDQQLAGIAMQEAAGAQQAIRDAEEDRAAYLTQGVGTLGSIAQGLSTSYAEGNFGRIKAKGLAAESENVGELLAGLDAFGMPTAREQNQLERQGQRDLNDIQRAQAQAAIDPAFGGPVIPQDRTTAFSPLGTSARPDQYAAPGQAVSPQQTERMLMAQRRLGQQEARDIQRAIRRNPELLRAQSDPYDPFGGGNFTPPTSDNATQGEARASVAPAGLGAIQPRQVVGSQTPTAQLQGGRRRVSAAPFVGDGSFYNEKGRNEQESTEDLVNILKEVEGLTDAEVEIARDRFVTGQDGSVSFQMPPRELQNEYFNREPQASGARASVAPAGVGGPVAPAPAPERRPVEARTSVVASNRNTARSKMEANIRRTSGLEGADLVNAMESIETNQGEDGKWTATYTPPAAANEGSRAQVQSAGEPTMARELLDKLAAEGQEPIATPNPTSKEIESVNTEALEKAAEVGPAAEEVVRSATEGVTSSNPLPIAMQWLNVREPNYKEYDPAKGDSVYVKTPTITPEGQKLLTEVWAGVGQTEAGQKSYIKQEQAWCAGFVNMVLADSNLTASLIGKNQKGRADMYMSAKFGENIFTNESIKRSNLHQDLKGQPEKYGFPKVKGSVKDAKMGDVVIINRLNGKRPDTRHVGFFAGYDKDGNMKVLGGNQGDEVNITVYNSSDVIGIRRVNQPDLTDKQLESVSKIVTRKEGGTR